MKYVAVILTFFFIGTSAFAQSPSDEILVKAFIKASKIQNDSSRLARFDMLAKRATLLAEDSSEEESNGNWLIQTKDNPLDDTKTIFGAIRADQGTNSYGDKPVFVARCKSDDITVFINWGEYLGDDARITYRIGESESQSKNWSVSTDSKSTFIPRNEDDFLKKLQNNDRFVAQVTPYNSNPITAVFNITGVNEVVSQVLSCGK